MTCTDLISDATRVGRRGNRRPAAAVNPQGLVHAFFATGTGTPAIFTLNEPRLARVQK
jgi:hypothetical protein